MPGLSKQRINLKKISGYAIFINSLQIIAALLVALLSLLRGDNAFNGRLEQMTLSVMALIVIFGAVLDIRDAFSARRIGDESDMLEQAYDQLSVLNGTLRAQRHDFMNHLQVVFSLMELEDYDDARGYIEKVYGDIQRVSRTLKTAIPAVNALLASKLSECEERGVTATLTIGSSYQDMPIPDWELCRVFSNLIDNALDALKDREYGELRIQTGETLHDFFFTISNNGPAIPQTLAEHIFQQGFSTKGSGRGMGLSITQGILTAHGGKLALASDEGETVFSGTIPKVQPEVY